MFLRTRWYDPRSGRFVSKDPFPGYAGLPSTLHTYAYCLNNSINCTDSSGEFPPWLNDAADFVGGAFNQYLEDMLWFTALIPAQSKTNVRFATSVVNNLAKRWIDIPSDFPTVDQSTAAYQSGRNLGRAASTVVGVVEVIGGIKIIQTSVTAGPPLIALGTCAGGGGLSWATGGATVVAVGAGVATGATLVGHGLGVLFNNSANPVNGISGDNRFRVHNPNQGPEIALGHSGSSPDYPGLEQFARSHNALPNDKWLDGHLIDPREPSHFASWFRQAMNRTKGVHFALDGTGYPDLSDALEDGAKGFGLFRGQYTNVELHNILSNREWYNKTTFYFQGKVVDKANVPFGVR